MGRIKWPFITDLEDVSLSCMFLSDVCKIPDDSISFVSERFPTIRIPHFLPFPRNERHNLTNLGLQSVR